MDYNIPASRCQPIIDTDPIRFMRAQKLVDDNDVELLSDDGSQRIYSVASDSDTNTQYKVYRSDHDAICTCFDSVHNHNQCKHIVAVLMIDPIKYDTVDSSWAWEDVRVTPDITECLNWLYLFSDMAKPIPMSTEERKRFTSNRQPIVKEVELAKGKPRFTNKDSENGWYDGSKFDAVFLFGGTWYNTNKRSDCRSMIINVYYDRKGEQWCMLRKRDGFCTTTEYKSPKGLIDYYKDQPKNAMVNHFVKGMKLFIIALDTHKELFGEYPKRMEFDNLLFHESSVYFQRDAGTPDEFAIDVSISHEDGKSVVIQHTLQRR